VAELDAIDGAIWLFDPKSRHSRQYLPRHAAFRSEMMRHVMGYLRLSEAKPVTTRDIALVVMKARGLNPEDAELLVTIRKRVGACMWKLKQAGAVKEIAGVGNMKEWVLPAE
jgi:hypothetical protein